MVLQHEGCYKLPDHLFQSQSCDKYITSLGTSYGNAKAQDREKNRSLSFIIYTKIRFWNFISLKLQVVVDPNGDMKTKNKKPYRWNLMCLWVQLNSYVFIYKYTHLKKDINVGEEEGWGLLIEGVSEWQNRCKMQSTPA